MISSIQLVFGKNIATNDVAGRKNAELENGDNAITGPIYIKLRYGNDLPRRNYHQRLNY